MTADNSTPGDDREREDQIEIEPDSKRGTEGEAASEGRRAGANSDEAGRPLAPQTGNPRAPDRRG